MIRSHVLFACLAVAMSISALADNVWWPAPTAEELSKGRDEYISLLDQAVKLSAEQKREIRTWLEACGKEYLEFKAQNALQFKTAQQELASAREAGDKDKEAAASKAYMEASRAGTDEPEAMGKKQQARVMALLTEQQRIAWRVAQLAKEANRRVAPAELSAEQVKKLQAAFADWLADDTFVHFYPSIPVGAFRPTWTIDYGGRTHRPVTEVAMSLLTAEQKEQVLRSDILDKTRELFYASGSGYVMFDRPFKEFDLKAVCEELRTGGATAGETFVGLGEKILGVLTDKQKDALLMDWLAVSHCILPEWGPGVELSDEQETMLKAACGESATLWEEALKRCFRGPLAKMRMGKPFTDFVGTLSAEQREAMLRALLTQRQSDGERDGRLVIIWDGFTQAKNSMPHVRNGA